MKSGFVVLIGRSNVGKSTLLNTLVGTKISATSFRPQMTRHIIHGVMNTPLGQAIFIDTPGILKDKRNALTARLTNKARQALEDIDLIVYVVDPGKTIGLEERAVFGMIRHLPMPKLLVINKSDLPQRACSAQVEYEAWAEEFDGVFIISALRGSHIRPLKNKVMELLPEGKPVYPEEQWTNIDSQFWIAEIIREKIFSVLDKEIPYSVAVEVDDVTDKGKTLLITARILTNQKRYKSVIIGADGKKIKEIGTMARRELEAATNTKIFLALEVEVDSHWVERV